MWQGQTGCFNNDMVGLVLACEQLFHRRDEVISHGAADAAVRQLHDVVLGAGLVAAAFENVAVHAEIAELVDDQRDAFAFGVL